MLWCATCTVLSSTGVPFNARSTAHLCMITAPRKHAYVLETSRAILSQITETGLGSRVTLSINVAGSAADVIDSPLAAALENRALATGPDCLTNEDTDPLPPCGVRQQGLDVANALATCQRRNPGVDWIVLLEDDFMPCDNHTLARLLDTLDTLDPRTTKFARFTQGGGGVAFPSAHALLYTQSRGQLKKTMYLPSTSSSTSGVYQRLDTGTRRSMCENTRGYGTTNAETRSASDLLFSARHAHAERVVRA